MKSLSILALTLVWGVLPACTGNLSPRTARRQIAELGDAALPTDDIQIQRIVTELGNRAIAEAHVRTTFQFERNADGEWTIVAVRLGDRDWIDVDRLLAAIEAQDADDTAAALEGLAVGIDAFRARNGSLPEVSPARPVSDVLHPLFMNDLIRDDAWGGRIRYTADGDGYELRAPGPDGAAGTGDDVVLRRPASSP